MVTLVCRSKLSCLQYLTLKFMKITLQFKVWSNKNVAWCSVDSSGRVRVLKGYGGYGLTSWSRDGSQQDTHRDVGII